MSHSLIQNCIDKLGVELQDRIDVIWRYRPHAGGTLPAVRARLPVDALHEGGGTISNLCWTALQAAELVGSPGA